MLRIRAVFYLWTVAALLRSVSGINFALQNDGDCAAALKADAVGVLPAACLHFVHVTKTGGSSVETVLAKQCGIGGNGHRITAKKVLRDGRIPITIIRDPIDRFVSAFYYWKNGVLQASLPNHKTRRREEGFAAEVRSPGDFIDAAQNVTDVRHDVVMEAMTTLENFTWGQHWAPQTAWTDGDEGRTVRVCYSKRQLLHDFQSTLKALGVACLLTFGELNVSERPREEEPSFTVAQAAWLRRKYAADFTQWEDDCAQEGTRGHRLGLARSLTPAKVAWLVRYVRNYWRQAELYSQRPDWFGMEPTDVLSLVIVLVVARIAIGAMCSTSYKGALQADEESGGPTAWTSIPAEEPRPAEVSGAEPAGHEPDGKSSHGGCAGADESDMSGLELGVMPAPVRSGEVAADDGSDDDSEWDALEDLEDARWK